MSVQGRRETRNDWPVRRLRALADVTLGRQRSPKHASGPHMVPYLRAANVLDGQLDLTDVKEMNFTPNEQVVYSLKPGDVLITEGSGSLSTVGASAVWNGELDGVVCFQNTLLRARPQSGMDPRYLAWWCRSAFGSGLFASVATGANIFHLSGERVRSIQVALPSPSAQTRIADFLDRETARIDGLIESKGCLRRLLVDRWAWEIELAVTRGLDPKRELRACSSSLFGRLPEGWVALPLKRRWRVIDCKHRTPEYMPSGYPLATPGDVEDGRLVLGRTERYVGEADFWNLTEGGRRPKRGDIIYTRNASIGVAAYVDTDEPFSMGQDVCLITSDDQDQRFLAYFLNSVAVRQLEANKIGVTFDRINVSQILELEVPCPPPSEQRGIGEHLDARRSAVEELLSKLDTQLDRLMERRQALITAAVTGELDVARAS